MVNIYTQTEKERHTRIDNREQIKASSEFFVQQEIDAIIAMDPLYYKEHQRELEIPLRQAKSELIIIRNTAIDNERLIFDHNGNFLCALADGGGLSSLTEFDWVNTQSTNFRNWFGNSMIKNPITHEPQIAWHGSPRKFSAFDPNALGEYRWRNKGIHFSDRKEITEQYARKAINALQKVLQDIYQSLQKNETQANFSETINTWNAIVEDLITNGKSSIYYKNSPHTANCDWIEYMGNRWGMEWFPEIFNGNSWPRRENIEKREYQGNQYIIGKGVGEYYYQAFLRVLNGEIVESTDIDLGYEQMEKMPGIEGGIVYSPNGLIGNGGIVIPNSIGMQNFSVFDPRNIKSRKNVLFGSSSNIYF